MSSFRRWAGGARRARVRGLRAPLVLLGVVLATGCAPRSGSLPRPAPETLPPGSPLRSVTLTDGDAWVRHHLMLGDYPSALRVLRESRARPSDRLVRALQEGVVLHRAGDYERSNALLEWAEREADLRYTRSISRGLASLGINDRMLAYVPSPLEMAMIPFYRMANYLALGQVEGALVEARKSNALLSRLGREDAERCRADGMLLYLAGLVQTAGGERNDALVSLRRAESAYAACGPDATVRPPEGLGLDLYRAARALGVSELADSVARRYDGVTAGDAAGGDVLLLIERGFVSHRAPEALHIPIFPEEIEGVDGSDSEQVINAAGVIVTRLVNNLSERAMWGQAVDDLQWAQWANALGGAYVLRLAWPVSRRESAAPSELRVFVGDSLAALATVGEISSLAELDLEAQRPAMLTRLVARGLVKYLVSRSVEEKAEEEGGELAGFIAGRLSNLAANELERADTRSWSLLPDRVSLTRLRLPSGTHHIRLEVIDGSGAVLEVRDLGQVEVVPGRLTTLTQRVWGD